jgi:hypothetical protein
VIADLDDLLTALYVLADEILPRRPRARRCPPITDAELVCLAVAQVLLDCASERRFLRFARQRLGHLFPYLPKQPGYNKRVRALAGQIALVLGVLARSSPSWCDTLRLLDSTPVPCAASRETVRRSDFAGHAAYGYCRSHSRYFWGFRLMLLCAPDGMPIAFDLFAANLPERDAAAEILRRVELDGSTIIADKGFAGSDFEQLVADLGGRLLRPRPQGRTAPTRLARPHPPMDRVGHRHPQRPTLARTPRRAHHRGPRRPRRPTAARPRRLPVAQLADPPTRPKPHPLRPLTKRNRSSSPTSAATRATAEVARTCRRCSFIGFSLYFIRLCLNNLAQMC